MKKPIKYIYIALTLGVLIISAGLFWPATSSQSPNASAEFQHGMDLVNQNRFSEAIEPLTSAGQDHEKPLRGKAFSGVKNKTLAATLYTGTHVF